MDDSEKVNDKGLINKTDASHQEDNNDQPVMSQEKPGAESSVGSSDVIDTTSDKVKPTTTQFQPNEYYIKWIQFNKVNLPIILQNENGPCPLIAICNVLLLRENMTLSQNLQMIKGTQLINKLADTLFDMSTNDNDSLAKNIDDTLKSFDKLQFGLDVNIIFNDCKKFEYTRELDFFDLFHVNLYHGWVIDPQEQELYNYFADKSYNKLVEISLQRDDKSEPSENSSKQGLMSILAQNFLESTATQLTYYGLSKLYETLKKNELAVLFRNNHFSTIYKNPNDSKIYILCTDQGYLSHSDIVWETLDNIEGDGELCNCNFNSQQSEVNNKAIAQAANNFENGDDNCQNDYLIALSLQQEDELAASNQQRNAAGTSSQSTQQPQKSSKSKSPQASGSSPGSSSGKKSSDSRNTSNKKSSNDCNLL